MLIEKPGEGEFIEDSRFLLAPTLFERAKSVGFAEKTALLVTKKKLSANAGRGSRHPYCRGSPVSRVY